jgi:hypothetical protein
MVGAIAQCPLRSSSITPCRHSDFEIPHCTGNEIPAEGRPFNLGIDLHSAIAFKLYRGKDKDSSKHPSSCVGRPHGILQALDFHISGSPGRVDAV